MKKLADRYCCPLCEYTTYVKYNICPACNDGNIRIYEQVKEEDYEQKVNYVKKKRKAKKEKDSSNL